MLGEESSGKCVGEEENATYSTVQKNFFGFKGLGQERTAEKSMGPKEEKSTRRFGLEGENSSIQGRKKGGGVL